MSRSGVHDMKYSLRYSKQAKPLKSFTRSDTATPGKTTQESPSLLSILGGGVWTTTALPFSNQLQEEMYPL